MASGTSRMHQSLGVCLERALDIAEHASTGLCQCSSFVLYLVYCRGRQFGRRWISEFGMGLKWPLNYDCVLFDLASHTGFVVSVEVSMMHSCVHVLDFMFLEA